MTSTYSHLLSPGRIGTMELRNRIVMSPMGEDLCHPDGTVSDEQLAYVAARARGGVGLVMLGSVAVAHPRGTSNKCQTGISHDGFLPGLRQLADTAHAHGAKIALQLTHAGKVGINDMRDGRPMWVPSVPVLEDFDPLFAQVTPEEGAKQTEPFSSPTFLLEHHVMTKDDIETVKGWFAAAARRAKATGIDGIELHAGHGYLLDEFLSPATNFRTDEYGGTVQNRARMVIETIHAIRDEVGPDYPLWIRMNAHEFFYAGTTLPDAIVTAKLAVQAGVDALHVSTYGDPTVATSFSEAHTTHFPGHFVPYAREIKQHVAVPIITVGRIDPEMGDRIIADGSCDFVAMGRKLLADPELPNKLVAGEPENVKPCMYHYRCISQIFIREGVRCAMNPTTGRELELSIRSETAHPRTVLVVGGGPAGMEAARLAALRGHHVILAEATGQLGGKLRYAAKTYAPNDDVLNWLTHQMASLPIDVRLCTPVDAQFVQNSGADLVIVATGGNWVRPNVTGIDGANVHVIDELDRWVIDGEQLAGERIVIIGGGRAGIGLADLASSQRKSVTVVEAGAVFASQVGLVGRWRLIADLQTRGVTLMNNTLVSHIDADGVHVRAAGDAGTSQVLPADQILVVSRVDPRTDLIDALAANGVPVHAVGDCTGAGFIEGAMLDAATLAVSL